MKKTLLSLIVILLSILVFAQTPNQIKYQAVLRNADGTIMAEESVTIVFSILKSDLTTSVFEETHATTTNAQGLISINIGSVKDLSGIDWSVDNYFMEIIVNGISIGISQLLSVPYALHANSTDTILGPVSETDPVYSASQAANITAMDLTNLNNLSGINTGDQDLTSYATQAYVDLLIERIEFLEQHNRIVEPVTDLDGNNYHTVQIGDQVWMVENLKTTHYANGDIIEDGTGVGDISSETEPKYWFAYDDDLNNVSTSGRLYTWYTVADSRNICPDGWHAPTDAEWTSLSDRLGGESLAGGKLKERYNLHWTSPNTDATNETGFTALPGGTRYASGAFYWFDSQVYWWTATEYGAVDAWFRSLININGILNRDSFGKKNGFYVRCIKD